MPSLTINTTRTQLKSGFDYPPKNNILKAMTSPPSTTLTTSLTIASPLKWPATTVSSDGLSVKSLVDFAIFRTNNIGIVGASYPNHFFTSFSGATQSLGNVVTGTTQISFYHRGDDLEIFMKGNGGIFVVKINGEYISLTPTTLANDGGLYYYYIPFGSTALRQIDLIAYGVNFGGVYTSQTDTIYPAEQVGLKTIIVGDSFCEGSQSNQTDAYPIIFSEYLGWNNVTKSGIGATGFLADYSGTRYTYRGRVQPDVIDFAPDVVIFQGSINDSGYTGAQIRTEADLLFAQVKTALPNCIVCATSPFWNGGVSKVSINSWNQKVQLQESVESFGGLFLDLLEAPLPGAYTTTTLTLGASASIGATSITSSTEPGVNCTYAFTDGERVRVKAVTGWAPSYTITLDGPLIAAKSNGAVATQKGGSLWTGTGNANAPTGYGNSDVLVSTDTTHPSVAGHYAIGTALASRFIEKLYSLTN